MDLWIRTQGKERLIKPSEIGVGLYCSKYGVYSGNKCLGEYETEERCLEIIDEIQSLLVRGGTTDDKISALLGGTKAEFIVYEMPKE